MILADKVACYVDGMYWDPPDYGVRMRVLRAAQYLSRFDLLREHIPEHMRLMTVGLMGGTHPGDEEFPVELVESLQRHPIPGVDAIIANEAALAMKRRGEPLTERGADMNLSLAYPGYRESRFYEERRAVQLAEWGKKYDVVIDLHTSNYPGDTAVFSSQFNPIVQYSDGNGPQEIRTSPVAMQVASWLGFRKNIIVRRGVNIPSVLSNAVLLEIGADETELLDVDHWRRELSEITTSFRLTAISPCPSMAHYYEIGPVTIGERDELGLPEQLGGFTPVQVRSHCLDGVVCAWGPGHEPYAGALVGNPARDFVFHH